MRLRLPLGRGSKLLRTPYWDGLFSRSCCDSSVDRCRSFCRRNRTGSRWRQIRLCGCHPGNRARLQPATFPGTVGKPCEARRAYYSRYPGHRRCIEEDHGPTLAIIQSARACALFRFPHFAYVDVSRRITRCSPTSVSARFSTGFNCNQISIENSPAAGAAECMGAGDHSCRLWKGFRCLAPKHTGRFCRL